jgi:nicotinate-nucleotide adenylyltransferase
MDAAMGCCILAPRFEGGPVRVAIYGGSFNPPHVGHAMVVAWLRWTEQVDAVWLVPTYAHAFGKVLLPFELRVALCDALATAVQNGPGEGVRTETIERDLPAPSYTIDTLEALAARHPDHTFRLVVGADVLPETPRWKAWDAIAARFDPIVVGRGGYPPLPGVPTFPTVSSTAIREALAKGEPVDGLLVAGVRAVLDANGGSALFRG